MQASVPTAKPWQMVGVEMAHIKKLEGARDVFIEEPKT
jgi:hypothetical protein